MRILVVGENLKDYLAKCHEALRTGLRGIYAAACYGSGYPGHKPEITTYAEILQETYQDKHPDLLITDFNLSRNPQEWSFPYRELEKIHVPKAIVLGDYWNVTESDPQSFLAFLEHYDIRVVLCYFPAAVRFFSQTDLAGRFFPLLPCFDPQIFNDWGMAKEYDVGFLASGTTEYSGFYPERFQIHQKLLHKTGIKYLWAAHPGWQKHTGGHPLVGEGFSRAINSCRLFITTAGKYKHPNPKYIEILASKALLLAEMPEDTDLLGLQDGVNYVSITPDDVLEKVDYYLAHPDLCEQIAAAGQHLALQHHNCYVRAIELGDIVAALKQPADQLTKMKAAKTPHLVIAESKHRDTQTPFRMAQAPQSEGVLGLPRELILDENQPQAILLPSSMVDMPISSSPQYTLYRLVRYLRPKSVLEIGSQHGCSAVAMALAMRDNQTPVDITCIDPFLPSGDNDGLPTLENWYRNISASGYLRDIVLHVTTSDKVLPTLNRKFDFVLVDGSHEYRDVKYDFENVLPLVSDGGYIWLHDYITYESVRRACNEVVEQYGLPYAINPLQRNYRNDLCGWMIARKPLSGRVSMISQKKRVMIVYDPHMGHATQQARGLALRETLLTHGWEVTYVDIRQDGEDKVVAMAASFDVVYLLKVPFLSLVRRMKHIPVKVVFDLADALWKEPHRSYGWQDLDAILSEVDAITSDNRYVAEYGRKFNKPITIVPMATQIEKFDVLRSEIRRGGANIRIGWVGSQGTAGAVKNLQAVLQQLADRFPNLELRVLGARQDTLPEFRNLSVSAVPTYSEEEMVREVLQMDIGVHAIATDLEDYIIRGGMKGFLYMSGGVPAVCHNAGECADVIRDGETGMLAATEQEWFEKLDALIRSPQLRQRIGEAAVEAVRREHSLDYICRQLEKAWEGVIQPVERREELIPQVVLAPPKPPAAEVQRQADFNEQLYLATNADVAEAVRRGQFRSGWEHYIQYGRKEGRPGAIFTNPSMATRLSFGSPSSVITPASGDLNLPAQQEAGRKIRRPRILLIADVPNWVFDHHCHSLKHYLSDDFDFSIVYGGQPFREDDYDLIYPLEWNQVSPEIIRTPGKYITGIRSHLWWRDLDLSEFTQFLRSHFRSVHVVSRRLYDIFVPYLPSLAYVTHGVDTQFFTPTTSAALSSGGVRVGWAGNRKSAENKGFAEILDPIGRLPGVEFVYCGYSDRMLNREEMRAFYDSIDIYVCASEFEGNNNPLLEAAAMERAIVTTDNGTVPEYLKHIQSALIVERQLPAFIAAVEFLRDHPETRVALGKEARRAVLNGWDWKDKAEDYRAFFWKALEGTEGTQSWTPRGTGQAKASTAAPAQKMDAQPVDTLRRQLTKMNDAILKGDLMAVQELLQTALKRGDVDVLREMGRLLAERGQVRESALAYFRILELRPDDLETWMVLGRRFFELGDWVAARTAYSRALKIDALQAEARQALQKIAEVVRSPVASAKAAGQPLVAFAILTHNALEYTKKALISIARYTPVPYVVYVLDNASTDETPAWLAAQKDPHLRYELSNENLGVPGGRNRLIRMILHDVPDSCYLVFMDNDIELFPGWIDPYLDLVRLDPDAGIAGVAGYWMDARSDGRELRGPAVRQPEAVDIVSGGFACWIRAALIREMGSFDENLGKFWHEDDDYSLRSWVMGHGVYALPRAAVVHHAHKSGTTSVEVAHRGSSANQQYLIHKWRALGWIDARGQIVKGLMRQAQEVAPVAAVKSTAIDIPQVKKGQLTIVVDGFIFQWQAGQPLGISRVWRSILPELVAAMPDAKFILLRRNGFPSGIPGISEVEIPPLQMGPDALLDRDDAMLAQVCRQLGADVFMSTYYTRVPGVRNVLLMYDMIPEHFGWDFSNPEWRSKQRAIANASEYLAISHSTKRDLASHYRIAEDRITVAHLGVTDTFRPAAQAEITAFQNKYNIRRPYFLLVGKREGYKNPIPFYQAFSALNNGCEGQIQEIQVLAVGGSPQLSADESRFIPADRITVLPTISDEEMRVAYSGAIALVYPSVYEGFGLPVLEAMACGCPVIIGRNSSLPEVGGEAALYVEPRSAQEILEALRETLKPDRRAQLRQRGLEQARKFNWVKTASVFAEVLRHSATQVPPVVPEASDKPPHFPRRKTDYLVTAIVSTYKSAEFMRDCLTDLVNQTIADRLEIIVVDAASPQNEQDIVVEFQKRHKNILYIRTGERIGVYAAWNLAIQNASGKYITPLSTNDRLRRDAHEIMARALDEHPDVALVYGDTYLTATPHETFERHTRTGAMMWPEYFYEDLLDNNRVGPHPMWRKSIHAEVGYFDESFTAIGDQEFWLRIAEKHPLLHLPLFTGLYWKTTDSLSENLNNAIPETAAARRPYQQRHKGEKYQQWQRAKAQIDRTLRMIEQRQVQAKEALDLLQEAARNAPDYLPALYSTGRLLALMGDHSQAVDYLRRGVTLEPMHWEMRILLVDELVACQKWSDAANELARILDVLPNLGAAVERWAKLQPHLIQKSSPKPTLPGPTQPVRKAMETLARLLDAEDLQEALQQYEADFDQPLLDLIHQNATTAYAENQTDLAEGLDALEAYVAEKIAQRAMGPDWDVDVVVPVYGQSALVQRCVESVLATTNNRTHLIIVDDFSPGNDIETLFARWGDNARITLHRNQVNLGFLETSATGAALGSAPFILFLNSDTEALEPGWLEKLTPQEDDIAIAGAKLIFPPDMAGVSAGRIQHAGVARNEQGLPYHPYLGWAAEAPEVNQIRYVNAVTGACFLVRRRVWDELGGWDRRFGRGVYEDVDLCWQARKKGYRVLYQPQAVLYHRSSASENIAGRHLLYDHKDQNLESLQAKWRPLDSDEQIFFGVQTVKRWQQGRADIRQAVKLIEQGKQKEALRMLSAVARRNPDFPDALIGCAQLLSMRGEHNKAAEYLNRALEVAPLNWEARLRLVDEWQAAGEPHKAAEELMNLLAEFPFLGIVQDRARKLASYLPSRGAASTQSTQPLPIRANAANTLRLILEADDLPGALKAHQDDLDEDLLALVKQNAAAAALNVDKEQSTDLVEGLNDLAEYIEEVIEERRSASIQARAVKESEPLTPLSSDACTILQKADLRDWLADVVIPIYGKASLLRQCLESLRDTTQNVHLILVDDCSPGDEITGIFETLHGQKHVTLARLKQNQGFIGATRVGAALGNAPYILLLNSDTQALESDWLDRLIPEDEEVAVVGAKLIYPPNVSKLIANTIQHAGVGVRQELDTVRVYHPFRGHPQDYVEANKVRYVRAVTGACFLVRRRVWDELGGWDSSFGRGVFEDVDFCWRAIQRGYRVKYQPAACLYHFESASIAEGGAHLLHSHSQENLDRLFKKWMIVPSDEEIFFGKKEAACFPEALEELKKVVPLIEAGRLPKALLAVKKISAQCPGYWAALTLHAEILSKMGKYQESIQQLDALFAIEPLNWRGRCLLVSNLIDLGEFEKAAGQLEMLREVRPSDEDVNLLTHKLAEVQRQVTSEPDSNSSPAERLNVLLSADDLLLALQQHEDWLDADLLALVRQNVDVAREENPELAEGLNNLADYIQQVIAGRELQPIQADKEHPIEKSTAASHEQLSTEELLDSLLTADNLAGALEQHLEDLDAGLVLATRRRAQQAGQEGSLELAAALQELAGYIEQLVVVRDAPMATAGAADREQPADKEFPAETLQLLLEADDLLAALQLYDDRLNVDLLDLVRQNASAARAAGEVDLAEGLDNLAGYILDRLEVKAAQADAPLIAHQPYPDAYHPPDVVDAQSPTEEITAQPTVSSKDKKRKRHRP